MDSQAIRDATAQAHQPRQVPTYPGALLCSCGKLEPLDERPVYVEYTTAHVVDEFLATLRTTGIELVRRPESAALCTGVVAEAASALLRPASDYTTPLCPAGCDCSCCYGFTDRSCHCFATTCNCGGDRAAHGQKPLTTAPEEASDR